MSSVPCKTPFCVQGGEKKKKILLFFNSYSKAIADHSIDRRELKLLKWRLAANAK